MEISTFSDLSIEQCQRARQSRDARFDGRFYIAVKTTGIFCRPICPATTPKEKNVEYFSNQVQALQAGYRPCLRCRPDSAPGSWAWKGTETTFQRAVGLIESGELQQSSLVALAERLGISDRYLRKLFQQYLGISPKQYAQYHQLMFAKQLLHSSQLCISDIALACGFQSVRRFNDAFKKQLKLTPSQVRKTLSTPATYNRLTLAFRPPFNWDHMLSFYRLRAVNAMEWIEDQSYQRTFRLGQGRGWIKIWPASENTLTMEFEIDDITQLKQLVVHVRRVFDLDADMSIIEQHLEKMASGLLSTSGLRIPGVWDRWEAGVRAILGQQVSVKAAITQLNRFVEHLGYKEEGKVYFPEPNEVSQSELAFLKMPQKRKETLLAFAHYMEHSRDHHPDEWLAIKGIGPWTANYAKLRGLSEPDCFLSTDLIVKKFMATQPSLDENAVSPWGSYATFHCWNKSL